MDIIPTVALESSGVGETAGYAVGILIAMYIWYRVGRWVVRKVKEQDSQARG